MAKTNMSEKALKIMNRYEQAFVTDVQLEKYMKLGVITEAEYLAIYAVKHPEQQSAE